MKDDKLEKQFEEYFKGVNTPENVTSDAKKLVGRSYATPKFFKYAGIAASIVLVLVTSLILVFKGRFTVDNSPAAPDSPASQIVFYNEADLTKTYEDAYSVTSVDKSLKLIERFARAKNATVTSCQSFRSDEALTLVQAEISVINGTSRQETSIFVEYTDDEKVFEPLKDYYDGEAGYYKGYKYYLTSETADNGEPLNKLYINYGGVKYYFAVRSSDREAYKDYLEYLIK